MAAEEMLTINPRYMRWYKSNITVFLLLIILAGACSHKTQRKPSAVIPPVLTIKGLFRDSAYIFHTTATIYNLGGDTMRFAGMSCSYEDFFRTNTNAFAIASGSLCYKNIPVVVSVPLYHLLTYPLRISLANRESNIISGPVRIGMYYIPIRIGEGVDMDAYLHRMAAPVIWSNELDLDKIR